MPTLIFDIETFGEDFENFSEEEQQYLLKYAQGEEEKEEYKLRTALSPLTGQVIAIGYQDYDSQKKWVQMVSSKCQNVTQENVGFQFVDSEQKLLEDFWQTVLKYPMIVTFNGRNFDIPFLMIRSAINKLKISRNLMGYRYDSKFHCDLMDQMSFYGALRYPKSLHFYTRAFGIKNPKEEMQGKEVTQYYKDGKHQEIAEYCLKDVIATGELYEYWEKYLKF